MSEVLDAEAGIATHEQFEEVCDQYVEMRGKYVRWLAATGVSLASLGYGSLLVFNAAWPKVQEAQVGGLIAAVGLMGSIICGYFAHETKKKMSAVFSSIGEYQLANQTVHTFDAMENRRIKPLSEPW